MTPKQLQLEITNKESYSLWVVSDLAADGFAKLTLKWGPRDLWGGVTVFQIDVTKCEDLVYILASDLDDLIDGNGHKSRGLRSLEDTHAPRDGADHTS